MFMADLPAHDVHTPRCTRRATLFVSSGGESLARLYRPSLACRTLPVLGSALPRLPVGPIAHRRRDHACARLGFSPPLPSSRGRASARQPSPTTSSTWLSRKV